MKRDQERERRAVLLLVATGLPALSGLFLWLEHVTHVEFLLHLAAIPLEILLGAFLVERWLARKEKEGKRRQLMYLKSYLFRSEMRNVFISNFDALTSPTISLAGLRGDPVSELRWVRDRIAAVVYRSDEEMERVVLEYVRARHAFQVFMEWAAANDFEPIFHDMLYILHFIQDVERFRERNPGSLFVAEARRHPRLWEKTEKILRDGVVKFLDYAIELREKEPEVLEELLEDYLVSAKMRG
ncbi:MAG TPA: hypothetical protein VN317_04295 [Candidatus Methanoperedens sp.]|nr:hypothetical protein [Candidatus Methanoperedens sp.]